MTESPERIWAYRCGLDGSGRAWQEEKYKISPSTEYVRIDKLEELTAENEWLKSINANLMGDDESVPRYTTKRLKQEIARAVAAAEKERDKAKAALHTATEDKINLLDQLATAERQAGARVKIKPLEWSQIEPGKNSTEKVLTPFGVYTVMFGALATDGKVCWGIMFSAVKNMCLTANTKEEAKATAQADYERRIMFALTTGGDNADR